ncbi:MAG: hypothetical protein CL831_07500 [Crocinitomicaceae bacterium]|nr:hypothetical protein [Crocinitomicaceae bacterium]|tara:strand:- start:491 stop:889 length:399 start_codon:yes stop_codon:yes gene_type:complete
MKQIFSVFSSILLLMILVPNLSAQADFPGSDVVLKVFGQEVLDSDSASKLCCFAAYGWHQSPVLKSSQISQELPNTGDGIAERLLLAEITSQPEAQFFSLEDGSYVVVSSEDTFNKVYERFLINYHVTTKNK